jgi:HPt (histidine-containing phosphotransfer) domain-containing protein
MYRDSSDAVSQDASSGFRKELGNLDRVVALECVGGDLQLLQEIARMFLDSVPELMGEMRAALGAGDAKALERAAHTLRGCVCHFGAEAVYEGARNLEMIGRADDLKPAPAAFRELESAIDRLCPALAELGAPSQL